MLLILYPEKWELYGNYFDQGNRENFVPFYISLKGHRCVLRCDSSSCVSFGQQTPGFMELPHDLGV